MEKCILHTTPVTIGLQANTEFEKKKILGDQSTRTLLKAVISVVVDSGTLAPSLPRFDTRMYRETCSRRAYRLLMNRGSAGMIGRILSGLSHFKCLLKDPVGVHMLPMDLVVLT